MNKDVMLAIKVGLITLAVLMMARSLAQQVGYGLVSGAILAETRAKKEGML